MRARYDLKTEAKLAFMPTVTMTVVLLVLEAYGKTAFTFCLACFQRLPRLS